VHVIDDSDEVRALTCELLGGSGYDVLAYREAAEFLDRYQRTPPECVLLDIRLPRITGLELMRRLRMQKHETPIIVMTGFGTTGLAVQAFKQGVEDFLEKPLQAEYLLDAVQRAVEKDRAWFRAQETRQHVLERVRSLTERERAVFDLVASGHSSKGVAATLGIAKKTVDLHRSRIMRKLGATSIADLVRISMQS
jgi:FixJ family two-component response regulator